MFYDLPNPNKFVSDIKKVIDDNGIWCVQISYLLLMIKNMNFTTFVTNISHITL